MRSSRLRARRASRPTGRSRSKSESPSRPASAEAAPTQPQRFGSRTTRWRRPSMRNGCTRSPRGWAPTFRSSWPAARSSAPATARTWSQSSCPTTTRFSSCSPRAPRRSRRRRSTRRSPAQTASTSAAHSSSRRSKRGDLAALPPNDLASSPLARELRDAGAFRADVSGAGPAVYGLFADRERSELLRASASPIGARTWLDGTCLVALLRA